MAIKERVTPGMNTVEARAVAGTEVRLALKGLDQIKAAVHAELDSVAFDLSDDDGEAAS